MMRSFLGGLCLLLLTSCKTTPDFVPPDLEVCSKHQTEIIEADGYEIDWNEMPNGPSPTDEAVKFYSKFPNAIPITKSLTESSQIKVPCKVRYCPKCEAAAESRL